tara:strand:- start:200338 stop:201321 length:984 start_codon:yes stop_codon:yes gene_type:complete
MESEKNLKIKPRIGKQFYALILLFILSFLGLNIFIAGQAWNFTHFVTSPVASGQLNSENTFWNKTKTTFIGVSIPKSINDSVDLDFVEVDTIHGEINLEIWRFDMEPSKGVVALFHGYNSSKSSLWKEAQAFYRMGYTVVLTDLRASGGSDGNQCSFGYYEATDVANTLTWCRNNYPQKKVFLYGVSMGAAAILKSVGSLHAKPDGIIIQSSFPSLHNALQNKMSPMVRSNFITSYLLTFWVGALNNFKALDFKSISDAKKVTCPTLVIHGMLDTQVSYEDSKSMYKNLKGPKELATFSKSGHESILTHEEANWVYLVTNFMQTHNQ